ncbi:hydrogenase nickel incorporation protein HypB [Caldimonas thermodepolymerans]|jgi:hydrogenase accessory protein HypB|uniref:hydrogenase nickel incorporation protein HypB n=1 Tax=Caldimonas thermodepolymerans TaxID=215580 RepID=UPI00248F4791|nr:hydrogenase nickel incorporation protein HypB [Caldimonas thermodepolymerans]
MCVVCGCANGAGPAPDPVHAAGQGHDHHHHHHHHDHHHHHHDPRHHDHAHGNLHYGTGAARVSVPGMSQERALRIEQDVLGANDRIARENRHRFAQQGVLALNLVSSPGSGKTTLLCATIERLRARDARLSVAVIEGDQQTTNDAERIRATGAPAIQVNTGKGCHLDAEMVRDAFGRLPMAGSGILFIENVGNLVCPALWDLGEAAKVAVLSVTEGEDKPAKYPDMFAAASLMILNKTDLLPHLRFDVERAIAHARRVNPRIEVLQLSATTGEGMDAWIGWLLHALDHAAGRPHHHHHHHHHGHAHAAPADEVAALRERLAAAEAELARLKAAQAAGR